MIRCFTFCAPYPLFCSIKSFSLRLIELRIRKICLCATEEMKIDYRGGPIYAIMVGI